MRVAFKPIATGKGGVPDRLANRLANLSRVARNTVLLLDNLRKWRADQGETENSYVIEIELF